MMQLSQQHFDKAVRLPLRPARAPEPVRGRIRAVVITAAAHVLVVAALVAGIQTRAIRQPPPATVHIDFKGARAQELPPPPPEPVLSAPPMVSAPLPEVVIAAPPVNTIAAAAPAPVTSPVPAPLPSKAIPAWQGLLLGRLERAKRFPESARFRRQQGMVLLRFTMDRAGTVVSARIEKSSGYEALDEETLALVRRAQPLPRPPAEVPGATIELVVPVEFFLNRQRVNG